MKLSAGDSIQASIASFLRYLELRLQLLGLEAREAGLYLLIMSLLLVSMLLLRRDLDIGRHVVRSTEDHPFVDHYRIHGRMAFVSLTRA